MERAQNAAANLSGARNKPERYRSPVTHFRRNLSQTIKAIAAGILLASTLAAWADTANDVAKSLGVRPANLTVTPSSVAKVETQAQPQNQPIDSSYSVQYLSLVRKAKTGGDLNRFGHRGGFFAAGFAVVRNGTVVA